MARIAFAVYSTGLAGGVRAIFEVASRLRKKYDVSIIALGGDHSWFRVKVPIYYVEAPKIPALIIKIHKLFKYMHIKEIRANYLDADGFARKLGFQVDLIRALAEALIDFKPDAAIATWYPTALSVWLSGIGRPFFFMQDFPELVQESGGVYGLKLFETVLRLPFHFLTNSTLTRDLVLSYNREAKVTITGVGVDINTFRPRNIKVVDSSGKPIIMAIIRGFMFKGDDVALKALNFINRKLPVHAILVGRHSAVNKLFSKVKPEFTYTLFGNVDDETLAKLYSSSDIFIFTSYRESFGLPPLEAMACGTAVVTTNCGGNRDYAANGYNTLIVPPGDPKAVAEAALKVLRDDKLRERLVKGGMETAKRWTWDKVVNKFEEAVKGQ